MSKHIRRLIALLVVFALLFASAKILLPPKSFGIYGHYRADAVTDLSTATPHYLNPDSFADKYAKEYAAWSDGIHKVVKCQVCHSAVGANADHIAQAEAVPVDSSDARAATPANALVLPTPAESRHLCVKCHEKLTGRPDYMPQIDPATHGEARSCTSCHDPHSPLFAPNGAAIAAVADAGAPDLTAGKTLSATCAACHGPGGHSAVATFPNLACQQQAYLQGALGDYQSGARGNPVMGGVAKGLSAADVRNVTAYFSGLPCK